MDQERTINTAYQKFMQHAELFLYALHFNRNVGPKIFSQKEVRFQLYYLAVRAPAGAEVENLVAYYSTTQLYYLKVLQIGALSCLLKSRGHASEFTWGLKCNFIIFLKPQQMFRAIKEIHRAVLTQVLSFLKLKEKYLDHGKTLPQRLKRIQELSSREARIIVLQYHLQTNRNNWKLMCRL